MTETKEQAFDRMEWNDGQGFLPIRKPLKNNTAYFDMERERLQSPRGRGVCRFRVNIVKRLMSYKRCAVHLLDVGSGSGHFLTELKRMSAIEGQGIDVYEMALAYLHRNGFECDREKYDILTFWNSLEYLREPWLLWENYKPKYTVVTLPIFKNKEHILKSKEFRPDNCYWYFTREGFLAYMESYGLSMVEDYYDESHIWSRGPNVTFVFMRNNYRG